MKGTLDLLGDLGLWIVFGKTIPRGRRRSHQEDPVYRRTDGEDSARSGSVTGGGGSEEARRQRVTTIRAWRKRYGGLETVEVRRLRQLAHENGRSRSWWPSETSCVASSTSGQKVDAGMRDFGLLQDVCRGSEVNEQTRASTIFTAEQKLQILREVETPGVTISEVCRRNALAPSVFYRWRAVAQNGSASALKQDAKRIPGKSDLEARREVELVRLRAVIAEITAENLELKKKI